jgi:RimK family alpha-L-glutamate ligase
MSGPLPQVGVVGWPQQASGLLVAAWRELGIAAELLDPTAALAWLEPRDVAVSRLDVLSTLDGVQPGLAKIDELADRGVRVLNGRKPLLAAHDKLRTARLLEREGLPTPRTEHIVEPTTRLSIPPPLVVKPRFGSWGADVFRCDDAADVARVLHEIETRSWFVKHGALVQQLLPPVGYDLRLVVAGSQVVGAAERVARPGEWRTNVSLGGTRRAAVPSERACDLGIRAAAALGMDLVGVDLFPVRGGYVVLELNGAAEFDRSYDLPGADVYEAAADALALQRSSIRAHLRKDRRADRLTPR